MPARLFWPHAKSRGNWAKLPGDGPVEAPSISAGDVRMLLARLRGEDTGPVSRNRWTRIAHRAGMTREQLLVWAERHRGLLEVVAKAREYI